MIGHAVADCIGGFLQELAAVMGIELLVSLETFSFTLNQLDVIDEI